MLKMIQKFMNSPEGQKLFKKIKDKNTTAKIETATVKKKNASTKTNSLVNIRKSGRSATILNQFSLLNKMPKIKKKTLLGS
tara:strand:+ start:190 stop:432 length:243 start_codon:yes stop_codon:yes gene_type:complete